MYYTMVMLEKRVTSLRLSLEAKRLLKMIARKLGITQSGALEIAIRRLAHIEQVDIDSPPRPPNEDTPSL